MPRPTIKNSLLSLDTIALVKKIYPKIQDFYYSHLTNSDVTIATFYAAMRHEPITQELDTLIEAGVAWELRHRAMDRDILATLPPLSTLLLQLEELFDPSNLDNTRDGRVTLTLDTETQSQFYNHIKIHRAQLSTIPQ